MSFDKESVPVTSPPPPYSYPSESIVYSSANHTDLSQINDYLPWSIVNLLCGWGIVGMIPLVFSIVCRNDKNLNNFNGAQAMSKMALVFNIITTTVGLIGWAIFIFFISNYIIALKYIT